MFPASGIEAAQVHDAAPLFAALGDETRLRLLLRLSTSGPESITHLSAESAVSRQAIKKHLDVLSKAGLVRGGWRGREHIWQLEPQRFADARVYLERISRQWDDALGRLKSLVEDRPSG
ncbi:MAG TPA: helix-turn-helix transcriptional regulator [Thermoanaerobaculia bacterium]|jgi:DNA-binding transcriptional ArsR family regulator|nr:helix-turn-helix transcriptional regulator [Thermoanaerobaculia bacterium]